MVEITQHAKTWEIASREEKRRAICTSHLLLQVPSSRKHIIKRETSCSLKLIAVIQVEITVTAKILLLFLFGQHSTTLSWIVPHYNSPSRSFKASEWQIWEYRCFLHPPYAGFWRFFLIAKPVSYKVNRPVALKRSELFIIDGVWA